MKLLSLSILTALLLSCNHSAQIKTPEVSSGKLIRLENFPSKFVNPRNIDVWLPESYDAGKKNAVIYMQDGQMLFDSTTTWNKQEWHIDEVVTKLHSEGHIKDCIVVAIYSDNEYRNSEFFPLVALDGLLEPTRGSVVKNLLKNKPLSDNYLKFIVNELKPYIDRTYSTFSDPSNTIIMGSEMGGLIAVYAFCKYPEVFGCAGCISTNWLVINPKLFYNRKILDNTAAAFRKYLSYSIPPPPGGKIYFDWVAEYPDSLSKPYQQLVDGIMKNAGYTSAEWMTRGFVNESSSERSVSRRLHIPLEFLLKK